MSCGHEHVEGVKKAADCKCYPAVLRTYKSLLKSNCPESMARQAALRVYRYHHPEHAKDKAALTVESWIYAGATH